MTGPTFPSALSTVGRFHVDLACARSAAAIENHSHLVVTVIRSGTRPDRATEAHG